MEMRNPDVQPPAAPEPPTEAVKQVPKERMAASTRAPSIIVGLVIAAVCALSIWYLVRPQPLLVQGEADATRMDIAARVDGRVAEVPVERGQDLAAGAVLVKIDNPEIVAKHEEREIAVASVAKALADIKAAQSIIDQMTIYAPVAGSR
jgi:HlyD family secretion protein